MVLRERLGTPGVVAQQLVPVEMKIADDRHRHAELSQPLDDVRHRGRGFVGVDGDTYEFGARIASARICSAVPSTSAVSVLVIDCTTIG